MEKILGYVAASSFIVAGYFIYLGNKKRFYQFILLSLISLSLMWIVRDDNTKESGSTTKKLQPKNKYSAPYVDIIPHALHQPSAGYLVRGGYGYDSLYANPNKIGLTLELAVFDNLDQLFEYHQISNRTDSFVGLENVQTLDSIHVWLNGMDVSNKMDYDGIKTRFNHLHGQRKAVVLADTTRQKNVASLSNFVPIFNNQKSKPVLNSFWLRQLTPLPDSIQFHVRVVAKGKV